VDERSDTSNCGSCGNKCGPNRTCQTSTCKCSGYTFPSLCGGCGSWTFESAGTEGWAKDVDPNFPVFGGGTNGVTNVVFTQSQFHDGSDSLAVPITVDASNTTIASVAVPLCVSSASINTAGYTMSAWVMLVGPAVNSLGGMFFDAWSAFGSENQPVAFGDPLTANLGKWIMYTATFSSTLQADHISIRLNPNTSWGGTMYIDTVTLTGP